MTDLREKLRELFGAPRTEALLFPGSGTSMMQAAILNFIRPDEPVLIANTGFFADRWYDIAKRYKATVHECKSTWGETYYFTVLAQSLKTYQPKLLLMQAAETSTGVVNGCHHMKGVLAQFSPKTLLAVDAVLAGGLYPIKMEQQGIDILIGASQKAFLLPPGLSFILIGPRAMEVLKYEELAYPEYFLDIRDELRFVRKNSIRFTPPVDLIMGMQAILAHVLQREEQWYIEHENRSRYFRHELLKLGFREFPRSTPVEGLSVLRVPPGWRATDLVDRLEEKGYKIAPGLGETRDEVIRIAHFDSTKYALDPFINAVKETLLNIKW